MNVSTPARSGSSLSPDFAERPIVKELATKLSWSIGSTLHITYGERTSIKRWAEDLALKIYTKYHRGA